MSTPQNKELYSYLPTTSFSKLLKFCYFFMVLFFYACNDSKSETATESTSDTEQSKAVETPVAASNSILCFGDSITAGYGLDDSNDAYPAVLQRTLDSLDLKYTVINSGVSGETSAGGKSRIDWVIKQKPTVFLLELGANDGLRGVALTETRANLQGIIDVVKTQSPNTKIILAGMQLPPNMGQTYTMEFKQLFVDLAEKNSIHFIPFILKDVGGIPSLNQGDGIHPNIKGHKIVAHTVWEALQPLVMQ